MPEEPNYYIIVTRESLHQLPYSVTEIYGLRESGKYGGLHQTYNEMYRLYGRRNYAGVIRPATLVTEDAGSGFQFFSHVSRENRLACLAAGGKSNIFKLLPRLREKTPVLVIADGAAFGSEIARVSLLLKPAPDVYLYLPESFEWLLLSSGILHSGEISKILRDPALFIDSHGFLSWEQYFTALLTDTTKGTYLAYTKSQLNANYLRPEAVNQILAVMKGIALLPQTE